ncbi:MAG: porphobilinogen synthase [Deltaproteobacteria bacterium]|jgi:porphobilinogen synthase|nr:MAG: porphobilinogen synthase [Deltaproteobacteria bacterium]
MTYPEHRPRRLRRSEGIRRMVRETKLSVDDLIYPLFAAAGKGIRKEIGSMPGVFQLSVENLVKEVREVRDLGIPAILLFGIPARKDPVGSDACSDNGIIQTAVRAIKDAVPDIQVITDVCFCEYTDHGHCGILAPDGDVDNDATLDILARSAVTHARAGADVVAPSDMMDGRVAAIRGALDEEGYAGIPILSYAAKYASGFYGPFRDAAESAPQFGDRRSYQMDPPNAREALREVALDIQEGADIVMVKPALAYLDVICRIRDAFDVPVAAYNVSGEYSIVKAGERLGWVDGGRVMMEILVSIKRAGADLILTYAAREAAKALAE